MTAQTTETEQNETMLALVGGRSPEWVLAERPVPVPGAGEVLVRNRADS